MKTNEKEVLFLRQESQHVSVIGVNIFYPTISTKKNENNGRQDVFYLDSIHFDIIVILCMLDIWNVQ